VSWAGLWAAVLGVTLCSLAVLVVWVVVGSAGEVRALFRALDAHRDRSPPPD